LIIVLRVNILWGITDKTWLLISEFLNTTAKNLFVLLILVYAARVCPKNIEGTLFSTIMGIWNFGYLLADYFGALFLHGLGITETEFKNLWIIILISRLLFMFPLIFIACIPDIGNSSGEDSEDTYKLVDEVPGESVELEEI